jgi:hypothetical protein
LKVLRISLQLLELASASEEPQNEPVATKPIPEPVVETVPQPRRTAPLPPVKVSEPAAQPPPLPPMPKHLIQQQQPQPVAVKPPEPVVQQSNEEAASERELFHAPPAAKTTLESLEQLHSEFQRRLTQAQESDDSAKKRRYQRLVKQMEDAIKATKLNKPFNYEELSGIIPPGFGPIPLINGRPVTLANLNEAKQSGSTAANRVSQLAAKQTSQPNQAASKTGSSPHKQNENLKELRQRQALFKEAAIEAKRNGNDKIALLYLKNSKVS